LISQGGNDLPVSEEVADAFGALLSEARLKAGLSQEALGTLSGLDRTTISQMERGVNSPRLASLIRLAGALGIQPCDLMPAIRWRPPSSSPAPTGKFVGD
jgi:transcriptional regulator with XRE-family HTH domain